MKSLAKIPEKIYLAAVIVAYLGLTTAYGLVNPAFESPDEIHHYAYVEYLLRERKLPVASNQESEYHQPPLYYLMMAVLSAPVITGAEQASYADIERNPFWGWRIGEVGVDNKNQYIHTETEKWPYQGWVLRLHVIRWFSTLMQVTTILAAYFIGREVFPKQPSIRLGALAFVAFVPQFNFLSSSINNDNLLIAFSSLILLLMVRCIRDRVNGRRVVMMGVLIGLATITKISALAWLPLALLAFAIGAWYNHSWFKVIKAWFAVCALTVVFSGPILIRNLWLYGEPTGLRRGFENFGLRPEPTSFAEALQEAPNVWTSFWGRFGYGQIPIPNPIYLALLVMVVFATVGLGLWFMRTQQHTSSAYARQVVALLIAATLIHIALIFSNVRVNPTGGNGRYAFPALAGVAILLFLGLTAWLPARYHNSLAVCSHCSMLTLASIALVFYLHPAYARPTLLKEPPPASNAVGLRYADTFLLHGYETKGITAYPGRDFDITFHWQTIRQPKQNYTLFVHFLGPNNEIVGGRDTYPGLGRLPTSQWLAGQVLVDTIRVPIPVEAETLGPTALYIETGFYDLSTGQRLQAFDPHGQIVGWPVIGRLKLIPNRWPAISPSYQSYYRFGDQIALLGYDLPQNASRGQALSFTLYWKALRRPERDYTVFVHLLNTIDEMVAQSDSMPLQGIYPTGLWDPPEELSDRRTLLIPYELNPGTYRLRIGLYNVLDGLRLSLYDADGKVMGDSLILTPIEIE